ncbi:MAG: hypothetical protein RL385_635 [Pseudomonadota bacterium]
MAKRPKAESLNFEDLGDLQGYDDGELVQIREKLIADVGRIQAESAHHAKRISELNQARNELQREQAERARALRAVKHTLLQRVHTQKQPPRLERARSTARTSSTQAVR